MICESNLSSEVDNDKNQECHSNQPNTPAKCEETVVASVNIDSIKPVSHGIISIRKPVTAHVNLPASLRCLQPLCNVVSGYRVNLLSKIRISSKSIAHAFVHVESSLQIINEFKSVERAQHLQPISSNDDESRKVVEALQSTRVDLEDQISSQPNFNYEKFKVLLSQAREGIRKDVFLSMAVFYRHRGDEEYSNSTKSQSLNPNNSQMCKRRAYQFYHNAAIFFQYAILHERNPTKLCNPSNQDGSPNSETDNSNTNEDKLHYDKLLANFNNCREKMKLCADNEHQNLILEQFLFSKYSSGSTTPHYEINHTKILSDYENCDDGKIVGEGGYGSVFVLRHKKTQTEFACKKILSPSTDLKDLKKLGQLHREIAILKQVDHPNIVKLHAVYYDSDCVNLVMELCKGDNICSLSISCDECNN